MTSSIVAQLMAELPELSDADLGALGDTVSSLRHLRANAGRIAAGFAAEPTSAPSGPTLAPPRHARPDASGPVCFEDLFELSVVQELQDLFSSGTGVASIITRPDGTPITRPSNFCHLCSEIIRGTERGQRNCYLSDAVIGRPNPAGPVVQPCLSGGLWDAGSSITVGGQHIANWLIGQVRDETQTEETMARYAATIGADEQEVIAAFRKVPTMSRERFERISQLLFSFANQLSTVAFQNLQQGRLLAERERVAAELRDSEARLRAIGDNIPGGMIYEAMVDADGQTHFTFVSEGVRALHGCSPAEAIADPRRLYDLIQENDRSELDRLQEEARLQGTQFEAEVRFRRPDGTFGWSHIVSRPLQQPDGARSWVGIELDVTARRQAEEVARRLEQQLEQSRKLEALGQLAGGVAHDLNNMLTPILGYASLLQRALASQPTLAADVTPIVQAAERSRNLVRQLLTFARRQPVEMRPTQLEAVLEGMIPMLRQTLREDIEIVLQPGESPCTILADPGQLEQVLLNLAVNARDAMPRGGRLLIQTARVELDAGFTELHGGRPGPHALLTVGDTGCGMDAATREHIFDPFFTTKGPGHGTGLGLATVYGIVKQHGGEIHVFSERDRGTTFRVYFPLCSGALIREQAPTEPLPARAGETLLVVEDQDLVREMVRSILQRSGYTVHVASSGEDALERCIGLLPEIDLLLTDVVLTGISGAELYQKLRAHRPGLEVLFMTGYASEILGHRGMPVGGLRILQKPFAPRTLLQRVREALDRDKG